KSRGFYLRLESEWGWNSRYWEQRALLELEHNPMLAVDHAENAVRIEYHPHPLTTLAKIEFRIAQQWCGSPTGTEYVDKGLKTAEAAIGLSLSRRRVEPHPFDVAIRGL